MKRYKKYSNAFYKFLASYILILNIPIVILGSIYYVKSIQAVTEGLGRNNLAMLQQAIQTVDFRKKEIEKLIDLVSTNSRIVNLVNSSAPMDVHRRLAIVDVSSDFRMYMAGNSFLDNIAIYLSNYDIIITGNAMYKSYDFYKYVYTAVDMSYEEWLQFLEEKQPVMETVRILDEKMIKNMVVSIESIHSRARLITFTNVEKYIDIFNNMVRDTGGFYYLFNSSGDIFITNDGDGSFLSYIDVNNKNSTIYNSHDMLITTAATSAGDLKCYLLIPRKVYTNEIEKILVFTVFLIIICLIMGIIISLILANRNYTPIRNIISRLKAIGGLHPPGSNEYQIIESMIESALQEVSIFKETLIAQPPVLRSEQAEQLSNCLKAGDRDAVGRLIDAIYISNKSDEGFPVERTRRLSFDICNTVLRTAKETNISINENIPVEELLLKNEAGDMHLRIKEKVMSICDSFQSERKSSKLIGEILNFIDENISDCNMNLEVIAERFGKSSKYLSKMFKEETNCNFLDYLNSKRVEAAKEFLKSQDISDACRNAGFGSMSTFMRVFKKYSGLTPGMYKDIFLKEEF